MADTELPITAVAVGTWHMPEDVEDADDVEEVIEAEDS
jgi:hypothetical protein